MMDGNVATKTPLDSGTPWYNVSDDEDEEDDETIRRRIAERCQERLMKACSVDQVRNNSTTTNQLKRTKTVHHRKRTTTPLTRALTVDNSSSTTVIHDQIITQDPPSMRATQNEDGVITFPVIFDIWYTDPSNLAKNRGTDKIAYECALQKVGQFQTIEDFYAFHNAIDWSNIKDGSIIAYSRHGIKPQWEDPLNSYGGRFSLKHFPRAQTETVFTKIALGFFSGMLTDWTNYNLVSLHIRSASRGSDVQLWRRVHDLMNCGLSQQKVLSDVRALLTQDCTLRDTTVTWMPNSQSLSRNDSRMRRRTNKKCDIDDRYEDNAYDLVQRVYQQPERKAFLDDEQRRAIAAQAAQDIKYATPVGIGLEVPGELCLAPTTPSAARPRNSSMDHSQSSSLTESSTLGSCSTATSQRKRRFGFLKSVLNDDSASLIPSPNTAVLPPSVDSCSISAENNSCAESLQSPRSSPRNRLRMPYPDYDMPIQMQAWALGMRQRNPN